MFWIFNGKERFCDGWNNIMTIAPVKGKSRFCPVIMQSQAKFADYPKTSSKAAA